MCASSVRGHRCSKVDPRDPGGHGDDGIPGTVALARTRLPTDDPSWDGERMTTRLWVRTLKAALVLAAVALVAYGFDVTASLTAEPIDWELIDPDPAGEGGPYEVVAWGDGYVGVGGGDSWTSPDGRTWQATPLPDVGDGGATGLVAVDGGLVAVGSVSIEDGVVDGGGGVDLGRRPAVAAHPR